MKVAWLFLFCWHLPAQARSIIDATGTTIELSSEPHRIVTLAPSLAELASEILGDSLDRIVGVSEYTDYPPGLKKRESIGPYHKVNLEKILSLHPDLVLATEDGNAKDQILHLRELKIPVVVVSGETLEKVEESFRLVALALGNPKEGDRELGQFKKGIENIRQRARARPVPKIKVLLQLGEDPLVVVGKGSFLHQALELVGAENIYADSTQHYPKPAVEDVLHRNPDVILVLALDQNLKPFREMAEHWNRLPTLHAVQAKKIQVLYADTLLRPSLRLLEGLSLLENSLYGKK